MNRLLKILIFLVLALMAIGALLVFSASATESLTRYESFYYLFKTHLVKVLIALAAMLLFALIPYGIYQRYSKYALLFILLLLIITPIIGTELKGAKRWIDIGIFSFQPAELAKLVLLIHLSSLIVKKGEMIEDFRHGFLYLLVWVILISGLISIQPNVSTALIVILLSFTLFFVGGVKKRYISSALFSTAALGAIPMMMFPHSRQRFFNFIESLYRTGSETYQIAQAKIALGSGGLFGVGFGHSRQSDLFLPEPYGDFIFSILGEETGFIGAVIVLFIYLIIFAIGLIIAFKAKDEFGRLVAFSISFLIIISAFLNTGVVTGIVPTTGITLPFISFGGTSLIVLCISIGILINIGRQSGNNMHSVKI